MTASEANRLAISGLESLYGTGEAEAMAAILLERITGLRGVAALRSSTALPAETLAELESWLIRLRHHEPIQYVLREAWFMDQPFYVDASVLIPRPETEELVHWIVSERQYNTDGQTAFDIGTGSGCIAISLKKKLAGLHMQAIDASGVALAVAVRNAHILKQEVDFSFVDFLDQASWSSLPAYDLIVSNPPYIPASGVEAMPVNVKAHEPAMALFVPDENPLVFYRAIAAFAAGHLRPDGRIFVEIHEDLGKDTMEVFSQHGFNPTIRRDLQGKERMIRAVR